MGLLKGLFDDVVDIATAPARLVGAVVDEVLDTDIEEGVKDVQEVIKGND